MQLKSEAEINELVKYVQSHEGTKVMKKFIEKPLSKASVANRRLTYGVGINDSGYIVSPTINGERFHCPFYTKWQSMLQRCYSVKSQNRKPTYIGCSVCDEWLTFSAFKSWMEKQDWENKELDKDIVFSGNKIYSPTTCIFVSPEINKLLTDNAAVRGKHPKGVSFVSRLNKFVSKCRIGVEEKYLGLFDTSEEASSEYKKIKSNYIISIANQQLEPLKGYLIRIARETQRHDTKIIYADRIGTD